MESEIGNALKEEWEKIVGEVVNTTSISWVNEEVHRNQTKWKNGEERKYMGCQSLMYTHTHKLLDKR